MLIAKASKKAKRCHDVRNEIPRLQSGALRPSLVEIAGFFSKIGALTFGGGSVICHNREPSGLEVLIRLKADLTEIRT
jgi:hypothetical protein